MLSEKTIEVAKAAYTDVFLYTMECRKLAPGLFAGYDPPDWDNAAPEYKQHYAQIADGLLTQASPAIILDTRAIHESYVSCLLAQGWSNSGTINLKRRINPHLIPFEKLPEWVKIYLRARDELLIKRVQFHRNGGLKRSAFDVMGGRETACAMYK